MIKESKSKLITARVRREIESIFGQDRASSEREDLLLYGYDATQQESIPEMVLFPTTADEIVSLLKLANKEQFAVTPRGAGSGFVGGSIPVDQGVVLCFCRMNKILHIDESNLTVLTEPGVVTAHLQREVSKLGLFYPPDPASLKFSTIGGNVATAAGGPSAVKYGVTRDYILGMDAVLATGEVISFGAKTVKSVVGYDFTRLLTGSEGTLAVITKILLKLLPKPESVYTALGIFHNVDDATNAVASIIRNKNIPSTLEFIDKSAISVVEQHLNLGIPTNASAILLIETDGKDNVAKAELESILKIASDFNPIEVKMAANETERELIWQIRRAISPSLLKVSPTKINEDITVPRSKIPELISGLNKLSKEIDHPIISFGHAGDGNIHVNIMTDKSDEIKYKRAKAGVDKLIELTLALDGTLSGEHGIGLTKSAWIEQEVGSKQVDLIRGVKKLFDPNNILNPGKIVPVETS
ncbi:MAG: FAD-binding oxidoreductase [Nitrospinota bacterium]